MVIACHGVSPGPYPDIKRVAFSNQVVEIADIQPRNLLSIGDLCGPVSWWQGSRGRCFGGSRRDRGEGARPILFEDIAYGYGETHRHPEDFLSGDTFFLDRLEKRSPPLESVRLS